MEMSLTSSRATDQPPPSFEDPDTESLGDHHDGHHEQGAQDERPAVGQVQARPGTRSHKEYARHQRSEKDGGAAQDDDQEGDVAGDHGQVVGVHDAAEIGEQDPCDTAEHGGDDPGGVLVEPGIVAQRLHAPLVVVYAAQGVPIRGSSPPGTMMYTHDDRDEEDQIVVAAGRHVRPRSRCRAPVCRPGRWSRL